MNKYGYIKNPLSIVAIFAGIVEVSGTAVLPFILPTNQVAYMWFFMIFPTLLVAVFFLTLNFNHVVLYAPSDFREDQAFLDALKAIVSKETEPQESVKDDAVPHKISSDIKKIMKALSGKYTWRTVRGISKEQSLSMDVVVESLNWLLSRGMVVKSIDKEWWALTSKGRSFVEWQS